MQQSAAKTVWACMQLTHKHCTSQHTVQYKCVLASTLRNTEPHPPVRQQPSRHTYLFTRIMLAILQVLGKDKRGCLPPLVLGPRPHTRVCTHRRTRAHMHAELLRFRHTIAILTILEAVQCAHRLSECVTPQLEARIHRPAMRC